MHLALNIRLLLLCLLPVSILWAQNGDIPVEEKDVPAVVIQKFKSMYPAAKEIWWTKIPAGYYADFKTNPVWHSYAGFDSKGNWLQTEDEIKTEALPKPVINLVAHQYAKYTTSYIYKVTTPHEVYYTLTLVKGAEEFEIMVDANGKLLQ